MPKRIIYPRIRFWYPSDYREYLKTDEAITEAAKVAAESMSLAPPNTRTSYIEDATGAIVSRETAKTIREHMRRIWVSLEQKDSLPKRFCDLTTEALEFYRTNMYADFPYMKLCEGHWKVDKLWRENFSSYKPLKDRSRRSSAGKGMELPIEDDNKENVGL